MKNKLILQLLLFVCVTFSSLHVFGQLSGSYQQDFEGTFPPAGWQAVNVLGPTYFWDKTPYDVYSGNYSVYIGSAIGQGEDWLILPRFTVAASDSFSFWLTAESLGFTDSTVVLVSTTNTNLSSFTNVIATLSDGVNYPVVANLYKYYAYSLAAFAGQDVYVAFKNRNYSGDGVYIDLVSIGSAGCVAPSVSISAGGATTFCQGESLTFTASATGSNPVYQWKKDGADIIGSTANSFVVTKSGSYSVSVSNTCGTDFSTDVSITVNKNPKSIISPSGTVYMCDGDQTILAANTGNNLSYQWMKNSMVINGATNSIYTAITGGKYSVKVTKNSTGCSDISATTKMKIDCKALDAQVISTANLVQVYPNPSANEFMIMFDDGNAYDVQISNAVGSILKIYHHIESSLSLGSDLEPGMYLLQIILNNKPVKTIKLIKTPQ